MGFHCTSICYSLHVEPMVIFKEMPRPCIPRPVVEFTPFFKHVVINTLANGVRVTRLVTLKRNLFLKGPVGESDEGFP